MEGGDTADSIVYKTFIAPASAAEGAVDLTNEPCGVASGCSFQQFCRLHVFRTFRSERSRP